MKEEGTQEETTSFVLIIILDVSKRNESEWVGRSDENQRVVVFGRNLNALSPGVFCDVIVDSASSMTLRAKLKD